MTDHDVPVEFTDMSKIGTCEQGSRTLDPDSARTVDHYVVVGSEDADAALAGL
jgi:hypothetical protein